MKLSLSLSAKPARKLRHPLTTGADESAATVDFVNEFDAARTLADPERPSIAPIPNTYNPHKRMKNLDATIREPGPAGPQFEVVKASEVRDQAGNDISYGLNIRNSGNSDTNRVPVDAVISQKLKLDLKDLPDDPVMDEYENMPVEGFGEALLAGYGWQKGMGIGRNTKEDVKIVQFKGRTGREGLGFVADMPSVNEKKEKRGTGKELKIRESKDHRESKEREEIRATPQIRWLTSHIRVRIISKDLKKGRLYLKKGKVIDVVAPTTCDISMDESGELVQGVDQELLETALPHRGGPVLVLYGEHKGAFGSLVEKDAEREKGVVRHANTHEMLNLPLEQIAEYTEDPGLIGY